VPANRAMPAKAGDESVPAGEDAGLAMSGEPVDPPETPGLSASAGAESDSGA
jgi:hypothetical protein